MNLSENSKKAIEAFAKAGEKVVESIAQDACDDIPAPWGAVVAKLIMAGVPGAEATIDTYVASKLGDAGTIAPVQG